MENNTLRKLLVPLTIRISALAALGIAAGYYMSNRELKEEVPAKVTIDNVYYTDLNFEGKAMLACVYKDKKLFASREYPTNDSFILAFDVSINDPNMFSSFKIKWGSLEFERPRPEHREKVKNYHDNFKINTSNKDYWRTQPVTMEVTDWNGNVTKHEFSLEDMLKNAKPLKKFRGSDHCAESLIELKVGL